MPLRGAPPPSALGPASAAADADVDPAPAAKRPRMEARPPRRVSVREAQEAAYLDRFAAYVNGEVEAAQQQADADAQQAQAKAEEVAAELSIQNAELRAQLAELHAGRTEAMAEDDERVKLAQQAVTALVAMIESHHARTGPAAEDRAGGAARRRSDLVWGTAALCRRRRNLARFPKCSRQCHWLRQCTANSQRLI